MRERHVHLILAVVWLIAAVPSMLYWKNSISWLVFISVYAVVATHWDAYITEKRADEAAQR